MANLKVSIIEKIKVGKDWDTVPVPVPEEKPNGKGLYLKDRRDGKFHLVWREGGTKRYSSLILSLPDALREKKQKELYLASLANGLDVNDPIGGRTRLTVDDAIDEFLNGLTGRGNTVPTYQQNLRQFQTWNSSKPYARKIYVDQIDRQHMMAFKKHLEADVGNDAYTAVWKCIRVNKMIKTMLKLGPGEGPVKKSDFSDVLNRKPVVTTYRKEEREKFLAACNGAQIVIWTLFWKCGLRLGETSLLPPPGGGLD